MVERYTRSVKFEDSLKFYEAPLSREFTDYSNSSFDIAVNTVEAIPKGIVKE